ncbi:MAG TPA: hypothetical protein VHX42_04430 [Candidatus Babeliales bacterium]|jgi:hypothetical protein|nr:hypothetical protein [Candidatus Babeliales bacterium]
MFIIKSYIKYPNRPIYDLKKVEENPLYYFIDINNAKEILEIKNDLDLYYIYGVLHLTYNEQVIIPFTYYDLIDQLWAYFLNMIEEFLQKNFSEMYFPDQPLPMSMNNISNDYILFSINFIQWKLPKYEFFNALLTGAKDFFEKMILLIEEEKEYSIYELNKIKKLEPKIKALKK